MTVKITLPPGIWYSYWDDQQYIGPTRFDYPASVESIPIFVRGGTLLPMDEDRRNCFPSLSIVMATTHPVNSIAILVTDMDRGELDTFHLAKYVKFIGNSLGYFG